MSDKIQTESLATEPETAAQEYAGFWARFAAFMIDGIVLIVLSMLTSAITMFLIPVLLKSSSSSDGAVILLLVFMYSPILLVWALYFSLMESGPKSASIGKRWVGIKVLDTNGNRISRGRAFGRFMAHFVSFITCGLGFVIQPFTSKKQTLHDLISGTIVVEVSKKRSAVVAIKRILLVVIALAILGGFTYIPIKAFNDFKTRARLSGAIGVIDSIKSGVATFEQDHHGAVVLRAPNSWGELGIYEPPIVPKEFNNIYLSTSGVIMLGVASGVVGSEPCEVKYTPVWNVDKTDWSVASNCPSAVFKMLSPGEVKALGDDEAGEIRRLTKHEPIADGNENSAVVSHSDKPVEVFPLLVDGVDINKKNKDGNTPLFLAIRDGNVKVAKELISQGADVNAGNQEGLTALDTAALNGRKEIAALLIARGANVNAMSLEGQTPLSCAIMMRQNKIAELLIAKGADVNLAEPDNGDTPLHHAVLFGQKNIAELLIAKGADINAKNKKGIPPLLVANLFDKKNIARLLIVKGADVNAKNEEGDSALNTVAISGDEDLAALLIAHGADLNSRNNIGNTPLFSSLRDSHNDIARLLIKNGADVNLRNNDGDGPLHCAAYHGNVEVLKLLLSKGADLNAKDKDGETPIDTARQQKQTKAVDFLAVYKK